MSGNGRRELKDCLIEERKRQRLSQEEVAARIGVSRQAVSKWETGDALPDLANLMALSDALKVSMDVLCGRETPPASPLPPEETVPEKPRYPRRLVAAGLVLLLVMGSIWAGWHFGSSAQVELPPQPLPDTFSVSGVLFSVAEDGLSYQFVPSIGDQAYQYQITFSGWGSAPQTFSASYSGGVCTGTVPLSEEAIYSVAVVVSSTGDSRTASVASGLEFSKSSGSVQWIPAES